MADRVDDALDFLKTREGLDAHTWQIIHSDAKWLITGIGSREDAERLQSVLTDQNMEAVELINPLRSCFRSWGVIASESPEWTRCIAATEKGTAEP